MAVKLGGTFMTCAMGPVNYAGACIQASRMPGGIQALAPEGLLGGFQRGVEQAAKLAGVRVEDVERILPVAEVRALAAQLAISQRAALQAWSVYAGQLGGLLEGVADLTINGRDPDARLCLERLAIKVQRDAPFSEPLWALAGDVGRWQAMIAHCRHLLDESGSGAIAKAYVRRRILRALAIAGPSVLVLAALVVVLRIRAARARVDVVLGSADLCAARAVAADDLARASSEQRRLAKERLAACAEQEAREAREREERKRVEERAREAHRVRVEREVRCEELAAALQAGELEPDNAAVAGESAALLGRIAGRRLLVSDVGPVDPALPCDGTHGGELILAAFADALIASVWTWVPAADPSAKVGEVLAPRRDDLSARARTMLTVRAEQASKKAIASGAPPAIARASRLCALSAAVAVTGGSSCAAVIELAQEAPRGAPEAERR
jgi:hypothetical protein